MSGPYNWAAIITATEALRQYVSEIKSTGRSTSGHLVEALVNRLEDLLNEAEAFDHAQDPEAPRNLARAHYELTWYYWTQHEQRSSASLEAGSAFDSAARHLAQARLLFFYSIPEGAIPRGLSQHPDLEQGQSRQMRLTYLRHERDLLYAHAVAVGGEPFLSRLFAVSRKIVSSTSDHHPHAWDDLSLHGSVLRLVGEQSSNRDMLNQAVLIHQWLLQKDEENRQKHSGNLANALLGRYWLTGSQDDVRDAWVHTKMSYDSAPNALNGDVRRMSVINLANTADRWFYASGDLESLDSTIGAVRHEIDLLESEVATGRDPNAIDIVLLLNAGNLLSQRYTAVGDRAALDHAVAYSRLGMRWAPYGENNFQLRANLAAQLSKRASLTGSAADLDEAIKVGRRLLEEGPDDHPSRHEWLSNHARHLIQEITATGETDAMDKALALAEQAVSVMPPGVASASRTLEAVVDAFLAASQHSANADGLTKAISYAHEALSVSPPGSPERARKLARLAVAHAARHEKEGRLSDLEEAVKFSSQASDDEQSISSERASQAYNVAVYAYRLAQESADDAWLDIVLTWTQRARELGPDPQVKFDAEVLKAHALELSERPDAALLSYESAISMLPALTWRGLDPAARTSALFGRGEVVARAVDLAVHAGDSELALRLVEDGRQILWKQDIEFMSDLSHLDSVAPSLARQIADTRNQIRALEDKFDSATWNPVFGLDQEGVRRRLWNEWDQLMAEVRDIGATQGVFEESHPVDLLEAIGRRTCIIVVPGDEHGHALVLSSSTIAPIMLPLLTITNTGRRRRQLADILQGLEHLGKPESLNVAKRGMLDLLSWQWEAIVQPVYAHIDEANPEMRAAGSELRLWWCLTGMSTGLPVHATRLPDHRYLFEVCVSSQTGSITDLARAAASDVETVGRMSLVSAARAPGEDPLEFADEEVKTIAGRLPSEMLLDASRQVAMTAFARAEGVHVACHGSPQRYGSAPELLMADGPLQMAQIARSVNAKASWAYVSACSTAEPAYGIEDEGLTIASAFQVAGYKHVIGTLWSINDSLAVYFASLFYEHAIVDGRLSPERAAGALAAVTARIANEYPEYPVLWSSYIHTGP